MKQLLLALLLLSNVSFAFSFDIWKLNITLDEAIQTAKSNNIPLRKEGITSSGKTFNASHLFLERYPKNRTFNYQTKLLNKYAVVTLYFTKNSKSLYRIKVRWVKRNKKFVDTLYELLDKKYGQKKILLSNIGSFLLSKQRQWEEDKNSLIQSKVSASGTTLLYIDTIATQKNEQEKEKIIKTKQVTALIKDASKF